MTFAELLTIDASFCIHIINLQVLMTDIYKTINNLNPAFMSTIFKEKKTFYQLRYNNLLKISKPSSTKFGYRAISFRGAIMWNKLPESIKNAENLHTLKNSYSNGTPVPAIAIYVDKLVCLRVRCVIVGLN